MSILLIKTTNWAMHKRKAWLAIYKSNIALLMHAKHTCWKARLDLIIVGVGLQRQASPQDESVVLINKAMLGL